MLRHAMASSSRTRYCEVLGVSKDADPVELTSSFNNYSEYRSGKGESYGKYKEICHAYEVLSDPARRIYDQYGGGATTDDAANGGPLYNLYDSLEPYLYGDHVGGSSRPMGKNKFQRIDVSMEDLYNGTSKAVATSRDVICSMCQGRGSLSFAPDDCSTCEGYGFFLLTTQHVGYGVVEQGRQTCYDCGGSGISLCDEDYCPECNGRRVTVEKKVREVRIERGMRDGERIVRRGLADEFVRTLKNTLEGYKAESLIAASFQPGMTTGDLVFVLRMEPHPVFRREFDDLFTDFRITLRDALCGFKYTLKHLDGRSMLIESRPGEIVKPGQYKLFEDEGMPRPQDPFVAGRLYIRFLVDFPPRGFFTRPELALLAELLTPPARPQPSSAELDACDKNPLHEISGDEVQRRRQHDSSHPPRRY